MMRRCSVTHVSSNQRTVSRSHDQTQPMRGCSAAGCSVTHVPSNQRTVSRSHDHTQPMRGCSAAGCSVTHVPSSQFYSHTHTHTLGLDWSWLGLALAPLMSCPQSSPLPHMWSLHHACLGPHILTWADWCLEVCVVTMSLVSQGHRCTGRTDRHCSVHCLMTRITLQSCTTS